MPKSPVHWPTLLSSTRAIMPPGQKSMLHICEKCGHNRAESQECTGHYRRGRRGHLFFLFFGGDAPSSSTRASTLQVPMSALTPIVLLQMFLLYIYISAINAKGHVQKSNNSSWASTSKESSGQDLLTRKVSWYSSCCICIK